MNSIRRFFRFLQNLAIGLRYAIPAVIADRSRWNAFKPGASTWVPIYSASRDLEIPELGIQAMIEAEMIRTMTIPVGKRSIVMVELEEVRAAMVRVEAHKLKKKAEEGEVKT